MCKLRETLKIKKLREKGEIVMTKKEILLALKADITAAQVADMVEKVEFIDSQIAQIEAKAEKAREKAAEKRAAGDELRETVFNTLSAEPKTIPEIVAILDNEEITEAKVRARLSQLFQADRIAKEKIKTEAGEKMGYFVPAN